jgi:glycosyltransferase involved in cell wall biosynthesis
VFLAIELAKLASLVPGVLNSWRADVTWLERCLYDGIPTFEWALSRPMVLDVDDAIWSSKPFGEAQMAYTARRAARVIAGNAHIASWFEKYNSNIDVIPTAVDTDLFRPRKKTDDRFFTVGWTGSSGNFPYLYEIREDLRRFFLQAETARLLVVADRYPYELNLPPEKVAYVKWSPGTEASSVQAMDVGLMPLPDNDWTRGKCSFKMIQYMACGIPSIVSPVGMNVEVLSRGAVGLPASRPGDWYEALMQLHEDSVAAGKMGVEARQIAERHYSVAVVANQIAATFHAALA